MRARPCLCRSQPIPGAAASPARPSRQNAPAAAKEVKEGRDPRRAVPPSARESRTAADRAGLRSRSAAANAKVRSLARPCSRSQVPLSSPPQRRTARTRESRHVRSAWNARSGPPDSGRNSRRARWRADQKLLHRARVDRGLEQRRARRREAVQESLEGAALAVAGRVDDRVVLARARAVRARCPRAGPASSSAGWRRRGTPPLRRSRVAAGPSPPGSSIRS